jgi:hypothetical protein
MHENMLQDLLNQIDQNIIVFDKTKGFVGTLQAYERTGISLQQPTSFKTPLSSRLPHPSAFIQPMFSIFRRKEDKLLP